MLYRLVLESSKRKPDLRMKPGPVIEIAEESVGVVLELAAVKELKEQMIRLSYE